MLAKNILPHIKSKGRDDKYSEFLMKFLQKRKEWPIYAVFSKHDDIEGADLIYAPDSTQTRNIIIGYGDINDGYVHGARLSSIISGMGNSSCYAYSPAFKCEVIPGWFDRYIKDGKCCIDPEHRLYLDSARWEVSKDGTERRCIWCGGHIQHLRVELVEKKIWENNS